VDGSAYVVAAEELTAVPGIVDGTLSASTVPLDGDEVVDNGVAALTQVLVLESEAIHEFLDRLSHFVADHLSTPMRTILCSVTLLRARSPITVASSSDEARAMDEVQYSFGDGPCLDAARNHRVNYVHDVTADTGDWREYQAAITAHGMRSILAVPIPLDQVGSIGCAINLYADTAHAFSAADIRTAQRLAREAANTVRIAVRIAHLTDTARDLRAAMDSRTAIDLAAGIIMAQNRCSQDTAVTILKAATSARNLKLHVLAVAVIASITTEGPTTHFDN
jgi:GAF domain-containing protein